MTIILVIGGALLSIAALLGAVLLVVSWLVDGSLDEQQEEFDSSWFTMPLPSEHDPRVTGEVPLVPGRAS